MARRLLVLLIILLVGVGGWLLATRLGKDEPVPPTQEVEEPPPPPPTGRSAIAGRVHAGARPATATVEVYYRCRIEDVDITRASMGVWVDAVLRDVRYRSEPVASVSTGPDGSYEVADLAPGGYLLRATSSDGGFADRGVLVPLDGARVDGSLYLQHETESLTLRVEAEDGTPWSGAIVAQQVVESPSNPELAPPWFAAIPLSIPVPEDGRVVIHHLRHAPTNILVLDLEKGRFVGMGTTIPHTGEFVVQLPAVPDLVEGRVLHDGDPVPGARVLSSIRDGGPSTSLIRTTDADGRFSALSGEKGVGLVVEAEGFSDLFVERWSPAEKPELQLVRGSEIRGLVVNAATGDPVAGAEVLVSPVTTKVPVGWPHPVRSWDDGSFVVTGIPDGRAMVFVLGGDYVSHGLKDVKYDGYNPLLLDLPGQAGAHLWLEVDAGATVSGSLRDSTGRPVVGALVRAEPEPFRMWHGQQEAIFTAQTVTDADGRYELRSLMPDAAYNLEVVAAGHARHDAGKFVAVRDEQTIDLELPEARWLTVRVKDDESAEPIVGAMLEVRVEDPSKRFMARDLIGRWETGPNGAVLAGPLPPGKTWVKAGAPEHIGRDLQAVEDGATEFDLTLEKGLVIAGRVEWADGTTAEGAAVMLTTYVPNRDILDTSRNLGADGTFRFAGLPEGEYEFLAYRVKDGETFNAEVKAQAGDEDLKIVLGADGTMTGDGSALEVRVVGPDEKPVPSAYGIYRDIAAEPYWIRVSDGVARLERTTPGGVVEVWHAAGADGKPLPYGPASITLPDEPEDADLRIVMPAEQTIEGIILDPDGKGVKGVMVEAHPPRKKVPFMPPFDGSREGTFDRTDEEGRFVLRGLGDKTYTVTFSTPATYPPVGSRELPGGAKGVEVKLIAGVSATVTVLGPDGDPVEGAEVRVMVGTYRMRQEYGRPSRVLWIEPVVTGTTNATGVVRLSGLDPDREQHLEVRPPKSQSDLKEKEIKPWSPSDTTVRMEEGFVVSGRVVDAEGKPVVGARISWKTGASHWFVQPCRSDGSFIFWDLSPGDVLLRVEMDPPRGPLAEKTVAAGTTDVVLVVEDPGVSLTVRIENWQWSAQGVDATIRSESTYIASAQRRISSDGSVTFHGLRPDWTYTLWVPPVGEGVSLMKTGIPGDAGEIMVTLVPGFEVSGRVLLPDGATDAAVWATELPFGIEMAVPGTVGPDGRYVIKGLPEGEWYVHARAEHQGGILEGKVSVKAGKAADIDLR